jgi:hypothetical protein
LALDVAADRPRRRRDLVASARESPASPTRAVVSSAIALQRRAQEAEWAPGFALIASSRRKHLLTPQTASDGCPWAQRASLPYTFMHRPG